MNEDRPAFAPVGDVRVAGEVFGVFSETQSEPMNRRPDAHLGVSVTRADPGHDLRAGEGIPGWTRRQWGGLGGFGGIVAYLDGSVGVQGIAKSGA